jgi:hypothetical protein
MKKVAVLLLGAVLLLPVAAHAQKRRPIWYLRSNPASDCTDALAQGQRCTMNLKIQGPQRSRGSSPTAMEGIVRSITLLSIENLAWDINIYTSDKFGRTNMDDDPFLDYHAFAASDGKQTSATAGFGDQYRYAVTGMTVHYRDRDRVVRDGTGKGPIDPGESQLHIEVVNRDSTVKSEGSAGAIAVIIGIEPLLD